MNVKAQVRILDWHWRGNESHALPCGHPHYIRSTIGVGVTVETIATYNQEHKVEIKNLAGSVPTERTEATIRVDEPATRGMI